MAKRSLDICSAQRGEGGGLLRHDPEADVGRPEVAGAEVWEETQFATRLWLLTCRELRGRRGHAHRHDQAETDGSFRNTLELPLRRP